MGGPFVAADVSPVAAAPETVAATVAVPVPSGDVFAAYMTPILAKEGGGQYTDTAGDAGGPTKWGVTEARARSAGYTGDMQELTQQQALDIYRLFFWIQPMFDRLVPIMPELARYALDLGINMGPATPGHFLQRALNVLGAKVTADGVIGAMTRQALSSYLAARGKQGRTVLMEMVQAQASVFYIGLAEAKPTNLQFEYGWQRTRAFGLPG